jgi:hypothetical protein
MNRRINSLIRLKVLLKKFIQFQINPLKNSTQNIFDFIIIALSIYRKSW